ncbi:MAG: thioredoxin-like domain-containing protein [Crocinitomicaceae bacterium]
MKKLLVLLIILGAGLKSNAQNLTFNVNGLNDTTVYLAKYLGKQLFYADTTQAKNGSLTFDGKKHPRGLYAVVIPGVQYFEFIHDNEEVEMSIGNMQDMIGSMKVAKSTNNKVFYEYILFMTEKKKKSAQFNPIFKDSTATKKDKEEATAKLKAIGKEILEGQKKFYKANQDRFIGTMILMSMETEYVDPPKDKDGNITDSNFVYNHYIKHFWDGVDFKDDAIVRTPVFHNKLDKFFSQQGIIQIPDSITAQAKIILDQMEYGDQNNQVFQYTVHHITQKYEASKIMGMGRVFVYMADNYYCGANNHAWWMSEENSKKLCERADKMRRTMIGEPSPMLILPDSTEKNWINSYKLPAEFTVLYFWDPDCGHCKKTTPKLQRLYDEKFKERNIEVYAVGKATGEDFEKWKKYIRENELTFINVGLTKSVYNQAMEDPRPLLQKTTIESLNYTDTYDIYSTPRIFILDKDKKILFKQLSIGQLEEILDNLTGHKGDVKLYPKEDPENGATDPDDH